VAPVRDLIRVKESGHDTVMTLCSMCYNTLARANELMKNDEEKRKTINDFMDEEPDYAGDVKVVHFLDYVRDEIGWDKVRELVKVPLTDLKVAPYYGCTLLRPSDVAIDRPDRPAVLNDFLEALGATAVDFPSATTCCSAYQVLGAPEASLKISRDILQDGVANGAEALALACPLCDYNLGKRQDAMIAKFNDSEVPIFYFTQLMAIAFGLPMDVSHFELNRKSALGLLEGKGLLAKAAV
jgi:heterodisulfide reductase subunit B